MKTLSPGPWKTRDAEEGVDITTDNELWIATVHGIPSLCRADALLIAEAGTVAHESGLTPRELLAQREALREALVSAVAWLESAKDDEPEDYDSSDLDSAIKQAREALRLAAGLEDKP